MWAPQDYTTALMTAVIGPHSPPLFFEGHADGLIPLMCILREPVQVTIETQHNGRFDRRHLARGNSNKHGLLISCKGGVEVCAHKIKLQILDAGSPSTVAIKSCAYRDQPFEMLCGPR
jgi:hypothetical protein